MQLSLFDVEADTQPGPQSPGCADCDGVRVAAPPDERQGREPEGGRAPSGMEASPFTSQASSEAVALQVLCRNWIQEALPAAKLKKGIPDDLLESVEWLSLAKAAAFNRAMNGESTAPLGAFADTPVGHHLAVIHRHGMGCDLIGLPG